MITMARRMRRRLRVVGATALFALAAGLVAASAGSATIVASNLANPRGIDIGPGKRLLVVESATGAVDEIRNGNVQTLATIGYGRIAPVGMTANLLVTVESLVGLLGLAMATGVLFARFSRPIADIVFSHNAIVSPYKDQQAFMFRIANRRTNEMLEVQAEVIFSRLEGPDRVRRFHNLSLERPKVVFFPLSWTVVHPIGETSPMRGLTYQDLVDSDAEILILLTGIDETFSQTVQARSSYKAEEIVWGARFQDVFRRSREGGVLAVDVGKLHDFERIPSKE